MKQTALHLSTIDHNFGLSMSRNIRFSLTLLLCCGCVGLCIGTPVDIANDLAVLRLCNASSPVSLDTVNSVLVHRDMDHFQARTQAFKCFLLCLYVEYEWMDRDGGFELHSIKSALLAAQVPEHRIQLLLYRCTSTESTNPCDRASIFTECYWSHSKVDSEQGTAISAMK